jgi:hypothetical protein
MLSLLKGTNVSSSSDTSLTWLDDLNIYLSSAESPLLPESPNSNSNSGSQLPLRELLSNTSIRGPTILCAVIMILQQLSGINAVMFYSTPILKPLLPGSAGLVGIGITLVNAIMTLPAIFLVDVGLTLPSSSMRTDVNSAWVDEHL